MATLYFNGAVDNDWNTLGNWWEDDQFTVAASALPTSSDSVIASASIGSNSGSSPTVVDFTTTQILEISLTVNGTCLFNGSGAANVGSLSGSNITFDAGYNSLTGVINTLTGSPSVTFNNGAHNDGNIEKIFNDATITFNDDSYNCGGIFTNPNYPPGNSHIYFNDTSYNDNGRIIGNVTFNNSSYHDGYGEQYGITGNVTFNNNSYCIGPIDGNSITVTFNDNSILGVWNGSQGGYVTGNAEFNDNSIKRGNVTGTITWNSSYPSDGSLTYYFTDTAAPPGEWTNLGNWWLDSSFTVPVNSVIGLPTSIDTTYIFRTVYNNVGSTPTVKNLIVGDSSYANINVEININVENSATFNNGAKFAYNGNKSLLLSENKTVTFNSNSDCYGTINSIDGTSLVNIVIDSAFVGLAFAPWGSLRGNIILQGSNPSISADATISSGSTVTINSGYFFSYNRAVTNFSNITIVVNNDRPLGPTSTNSYSSVMFSNCNITFNDTSYSSAVLNINSCSLTFNDDSYNKAYYGDVYAYLTNDGSILNTYQFNHNSRNYGFIALNVTWNNGGKGINGSSILGIV